MCTADSAVGGGGVIAVASSLGRLLSAFEPFPDSSPSWVMVDRTPAEGRETQGPGMERLLWKLAGKELAESEEENRGPCGCKEARGVPGCACPPPPTPQQAWVLDCGLQAGCSRPTFRVVVSALGVGPRGEGGFRLMFSLHFTPPDQ